MPTPVASSENTASLAVVPLCVDLDGTLVKSDTLYDSALALARHNPRQPAQAPWLAHAGQSSPQTPPHCRRHPRGRPPPPITGNSFNILSNSTPPAAPSTWPPPPTPSSPSASPTTSASSPESWPPTAPLNLAGHNKLAAFRQRFGDAFTYIGNARPDLPLLQACREPMVANPTAGLRAGLRVAKITPVRVFEEQVSPLRAWIKALRLHQWAKNVLIFLPLLLAHARAPGLLAGAAVAFLSFGLCASATYIVNDLLDLDADRQHPRKRRRPFASGDLSVLAGVFVIILFLAAAAVLAMAVPRIIQTILPRPPVRSSLSDQLPRLARHLPRYHARLLAPPQARRSG